MKSGVENRQLRIKLAAAEQRLAEALELNADLHEQLDRANRAAVRMARRTRLLAVGQVAA